MRPVGKILAAIVIAALSAGATGDAVAAGGAVLSLRGIGPLHLGMTEAAALRTGWLGGRGSGCPLGGPPLPITYRFTGAKAAPGIRGTAEFDAGRLRVMSFTGGVRTTAGVVVGATTPAQMVRRYRAAGFTATAQFDRTFAGTFVSVMRGRRVVAGAFSKHGPVSLLAIPSVPVCE